MLYVNWYTGMNGQDSGGRSALVADRLLVTMSCRAVTNSLPSTYHIYRSTQTYKARHEAQSISDVWDQ